MEFKNPQEELERFRSRLAVAAASCWSASPCCSSLRLAADRPARLLPDPCRGHRISLVPSCPTGFDPRPQWRCAGAQLLGLHAGNHASKARDLEQIIDGLAGIIDIQPKDRKRFKKLLEESRNFESLPIRTRLTDEEVAKFIATVTVSPASTSRRACSVSIRAAPLPRTCWLHRSRQ